MNQLYVALGLLSVSLGVIGIFVPVWPTTPFVLLSVVLFSRSDKRFDEYVLNNRWFGPFLRNYLEHRRMTTPAKIKSIAFVWVGLGISIYVQDNPLVIGLLILIGAMVTMHLALLKTQKKPAD